MSKRPAIRPPRKPQGESAKVTIGVLERQVAELTTRISLLVDQRDEAVNHAVLARGELEVAKGDLAMERAARKRLKSQLEAATQRFEGYRMCARELTS